MSTVYDYFYKGSPLTNNPRGQTARKIKRYMEENNPRIISVILSLMEDYSLNCGGALSRMKNDVTFRSCFSFSDEDIEKFFLGYNLTLMLANATVSFIGVGEKILPFINKEFAKYANLIPEDLASTLIKNIPKYAQVFKNARSYEKMLTSMYSDLISEQEYVRVGSLYACRDIIGLYNWSLNQ